MMSDFDPERVRIALAAFAGAFVYGVFTLVTLFMTGAHVSKADFFKAGLNVLAAAMCGVVTAVIVAPAGMPTEAAGTAVPAAICPMIRMPTCQALILVTFVTKLESVVTSPVPRCVASAVKAPWSALSVMAAPVLGADSCTAAAVPSTEL